MSNKTALIGSNGTIGSSLLSAMRFDLTFNSDNICDLPQHQYDLLVCAAPSGNRLTVNKNPTADLDNITAIMDAVGQCKIKQLVLISTIDTVVYPDTHYGLHRKQLENFVKAQSSTVHILRASTLIGRNIKKNVLFDLKNNLFIDKIDPGSVIQWCPLDCLHKEIFYTIEHNISELDLVSEPILTQDIIDRFFSGTTILPKQHTKKYNVQPYRYTQEDIFLAMEDYLQ
jgi:hypothetical protein